MDALTDDRGQSVIFAAALLAFAAIAVVGLRTAQAQILSLSATRHAGESAVEAASVVVADAYAAEMRARADPSRSPRAIRSVIADPGLRERARVDGSDMSIRNGGEPIDQIDIDCDGTGIRVTVVIHATRYRAALASSECSLP